MKSIPLMTGIVALMASRALAQGCSMCKTSLADQSSTVVGALQSGIIVLMVPPLAIMGAILYRVFGQEDRP